MQFARWVFWLGGLYGLLILVPQFFLEDQVGRDFPPPVTHPEFYYGFVGIAVAWQVAFLLIARDPVRYRPLMIPGMLEKAAFGVAAFVLFAQQRVPATLLIFASLDLIWLALFAVAYRKTPVR
ncbi:hypothetical protein [Limnoglobus roseus]|uniref:Uncharacterized protein n=1 Tax=Limnoglobus roseus TaxID=2598579 RepID=A0A5C1A6M3_9BACT|nr:hypothetical protein [Limnoglobus roseus]QEL14899.1 hypothetical protein PX52LOC_01800 [Limnoglobus roseus]